MTSKRAVDIHMSSAACATSCGDAPGGFTLGVVTPAAAIGSRFAEFRASAARCVRAARIGGHT